MGEIQEVDLDVLLGDASEGKSLKGSRVKPAGCVWQWQGDGSGGSSEHIDEGGGGWKRGPGPVENMPSVVVRPSLTSTADTGVMSAL